MIKEYRVETVIKIDAHDLNKYIGRQDNPVGSRSLLNGLVKERIEADVADALRLYGIEHGLIYASTVQS